MVFILFQILKNGFCGNAELFCGFQGELDVGGDAAHFVLILHAARGVVIFEGEEAAEHVCAVLCGFAWRITTTWQCAAPGAAWDKELY